MKKILAAMKGEVDSDSEEEQIQPQKKKKKTLNSVAKTSPRNLKNSTQIQSKHQQSQEPLCSNTISTSKTPKTGDSAKSSQNSASIPKKTGNEQQSNTSRNNLSQNPAVITKKAGNETQSNTPNNETLLQTFNQGTGDFLLESLVNQDDGEEFSENEEEKVVEQTHLEKEQEDKDDEDDSKTSSEEGDENRTVWCSARCTAGCKRCVCSKNGLICGKNCRCTGCKNTKKSENEIEKWKATKPDNFAKDFPHPTEGSPQNLPEQNLEAPELDLFMLFLTNNGILSHIIIETNKYFAYNKEIIENLTSEQKEKRQKFYAAVKQKKKQERKRKKQRRRKKTEEILIEDADDESGGLKDEVISFADWKSEKEKKKTKFKEEFTQDMIIQYLIATIIMGLVPIDDYTDHWNKASDFDIFGTPIIQKIISRDKFFKIHAYVHFDPDFFEQNLNELFPKFWKLSNETSIDEGMVGHSGSAPCKTYNPMKPDKHGFKYWALCDKIGYLFNFYWYLGKKTNGPTNPDGIVPKLLEKVEKKTFVCLDNWYGSLRLAEMLHEEEFFFVMTCRRSRPSALFAQGLQQLVKDQGSWLSKYSPDGTIMALHFFDRKRVNILSNSYDDSITTSKSKDTKPMAIQMYNQIMGGVDLFDQFMHTNPSFPHKKYKYTRAIFFASINMILTNCFLIQRCQCENKKKFSKKCFLIKIVKQFCKKNEISNKEKLTHLPYKRKKGKSRYGHCVNCHSNTPIICLGCERVHLCPDCFVEWHENKNLM